MKKTKRTPGPQAERLVIKGNWKDAVKKAFTKEKPASGWPKSESKKKSGK